MDEETFYTLDQQESTDVKQNLCVKRDEEEDSTHGAPMMGKIQHF